MFIPFSLLFGFLLGLQAAPQDDKADRIKRAIDWYSDPDPQIRELGRKELLAVGPDAVPYLEKLLELRNALDIYKLLRDVDRARSVDGKWVGERDLPSEEDLQKDAPKIERGDADRYVHSKLLEAHAAAKRGNYQRGYDIASALLTLEGAKSRYAADIQKIRRYCDNWITQMSLVRSKVVAPSAAGVAPGKYEFVLRMENVFKQGIRVLFDPGTALKPATPVVIVEITCRCVAVDGSEAVLTPKMDVSVEPEIPIALGAQWEKVFTIDTGELFQDDMQDIRIYTIGAWTQPMRIDFGIGAATKKLFFEPATFKVVPKKYEYMLEKPLRSLEQALQAATEAPVKVNEVFIPAMLVGDDEKPQAVELLVAALEKSPSPEMRAKTANILTMMTGQRNGDDPKRWRAYAETLKPKPKEAPKK